MAVLAIILGSVLGLFVGLVGFAFADLTLWQAFTAYLLFGIGTGVLTTGMAAISCMFGQRGSVYAP